MENTDVTRSYVVRTVRVEDRLNSNINVAVLFSGTLMLMVLLSAFRIRFPVSCVPASLCVVNS